MFATVYEKTISMLLALIVLIGIAFAILFGLWLSSQVLARPLAVPIQLIPRGDGAGTDENDQYDPNVIEPGMDFEQDEPTMLESIETVLNIVSENASVFADVSPVDDSSLMPGGKKGDGRTKGEGVGLAGKPRRWKIRFEQGMTLAEYEKILDYFEIELGILQEGGEIVYLSALQAAKPTVRRGSTVAEKRYYFTQIEGDTENADRQILAKAGIETQGRFILKFLSPKTEHELIRLEAEAAGDRLSAVQATYFKIEPLRPGYRFKVEYQAKDSD